MIRTSSAPRKSTTPGHARTSGIRLGLVRVRRVLERLGHPEDSFASVLIAGTNGKGSVSSLLESSLRAAGLRTGLFTSPHLIDETERVRVDNRAVSRAAWRRLARRVQEAASSARVGLTEFELQTLLAFEYFRESSVEIAVLEVGLGGRLDSTNAVSAPEATVIASIGHDHLAWLGPTLADVYREKAGIIRPGTPHFEGVSDEIRAKPTEFHRRHAPATLSVGDGIRVAPRSCDWTARRQTFDVRLPGADYRGLTIGLMGPHQLRNAALAVGVLDALRRRGWRISEGDIRSGLRNADWPGRFQVFRGPAGFRGVVIVDGAHNPEAADALLAAYAGSPWRGRSATLVFGCLSDKDARGMVRRLSRIAHRVLVVPLDTERSAPADELAALWRRTTPATVCKNSADAWRRLRSEEAGPVVVTGSLYLVGDALRVLGKGPARV